MLCRLVVNVMRHSANVLTLLVGTNASVRKVMLVMELKAVYLPTNVNLAFTSATNGPPVLTLRRATIVIVTKALKEMGSLARTLTNAP